MDINEEQLKEIMKDDQQTWFTLDELSKKVEQSPVAVKSLIDQSDLFVKSFDNRRSQDLYSTRDDFKESESFVTKIIGAFKNRID